MDWKTTQKKDKDSLKKLIKQRYGVNATDNGDGVKATINGKTYNWILDDAGMPRRFVEGKTEGNKIGTLNEDKQSIAPQKNNYVLGKTTPTPLIQRATPLMSKEKTNTTEPNQKANVQVLQQMQNNPKQAQTIADNSFLGTVGGAIAGAGTVLGMANNTKNNFVNNQLGIQQNPGVNLPKPSVGFDGLVPQVYANSGNSGQSKTDRQNEKWLKTKEDEAEKYINSFIVDANNSKDNKMLKMKEQIYEMIEAGDDDIAIMDGLIRAGYRPGNAVQKKLDWVGGLANKGGEWLRVEHDDDDGFFTSIGKAALNIPGNALRLGGDFVETVSHPVETGKNLWDLADTGFDYLNYAVTGDPLMDKSKATGEAIVDLVTDPSSYIENPIDTALSLSGVGNASKVLKGTKLGNKATKLVNTAKDTTKAGVDKVSGAMDNNKVTKGIKNFTKGVADLAYSPEKTPKYVYNKLKPKEKTIEDLKNQEIDIASRITDDKNIDLKQTAARSSEGFTDFSNERTPIRDYEEEKMRQNTAVEGIKETLKDIKVDENTSYKEIGRQLDSKETKLLNKQEELADNTPKWDIKYFDYEFNGKQKNRFKDILDDIEGFIESDDQMPGAGEMIDIINGFKKGEKISELQLLKIKRYYNSLFRNKYMKKGEDGSWELKNPTNKLGQNFENNQMFLNNLFEKEGNKQIKELDYQINNVITLKKQFNDLTKKLRNEIKDGIKNNRLASLADFYSRLTSYEAKISQILKFFGLTSEKMSYSQKQSKLKKNIDKLYKLDEQIKNGGKSDSWIKKQYDSIMKGLESYLEDHQLLGKTLNTGAKTLKTGAKALKTGVKYRKQIGMPQNMMEGIEDKEFENKYMK